MVVRIRGSGFGGERTPLPRLSKGEGAKTPLPESRILTANALLRIFQILHYLCTMPSIRQEKFARLLQRDLSTIIQQRTHSFFEGKMIMVNDVEVSPDLGYAKVYLGFINQNEKDYLLGLVQFHSKELRHELAQKIRNEVRKIPELTFYIDNTLDNALKMEKILEKLKENDELK